MGLGSDRKLYTVSVAINLIILNSMKYCSIMTYRGQKQKEIK